MYLIEGIDIELIVNEMINIESGQLRYIDKDAETPPYDSYPLLQKGGTEIYPRSKYGYIYVDGDMMDIVAEELIKYLNSMEQDWVSPKTPTSYSTQFVRVYENSPVQRHIVSGLLPQKYSKKYNFVWCVLNNKILYNQLLCVKRQFPTEDLFTIVCHTNVFNANGYYPGCLTEKQLNINVELIKTTYILEYNSMTKFWNTICGDKTLDNTRTITYPAVLGFPVTNVWCRICRYKIYNKAYSNSSGDFCCEVCYHYNDRTVDYTQYHAIEPPLCETDGVLRRFKVKDEDKYFINLLLSSMTEPVIEREFMYNSRIYTLVECGDCCCINVECFLDIIGLPRFTDKKVLLMNID